MGNKIYKFEGRCTTYAGICYEYLINKKEHIKNVQIKRYLINDSDPDYEPHHYYIEFTIERNNKIAKFIIDNYEFEFVHKFKLENKPKKIEKIQGKKKIKFFCRTVYDPDLQELIEQDINEKLELIYKWYFD
jgi:hypothetical protein